MRPDLHRKNHLGPRIRQDEEQGLVYNHGVAHLFTADLKLKEENFSFQPYAGLLADYTAPDKRDNVFLTPVKQDMLGTYGAALQKKAGSLIWDLEAAHNFGKARSADDQLKDITHNGYLGYTALTYKTEKFTPVVRFLACSGNRPSLSDAEEGTEFISSGKNRAFSYYSPMNKNLGDAVGGAFPEILPLVAMGVGYGLQYGIPRPGTFSSADFDNLIMPALSLNFSPTTKLSLGLDMYILRSFEKGVGTFNGEAKYLSCDLGKEIDASIDYDLNDNMKIEFLGGFFMPVKRRRKRS